MNKKFFSISLIILIATGILLGISKVAVGENYNEPDAILYKFWDGKPEIEFVSHGEAPNDYNGGGYEIIISVKNIWDKIISVSDLELKFEKKDLGTINLSIQGNGNYRGVGSRKYGIDPGETKEFMFFIPKEVTFDDTVDLNTMRIQYNINQWMFRTGENSLLFSIGSIGGSIELKNTGEPIDF